MKYTPGIAVGAMSGSLGGTTASRNASGPYFRVRAIPVTSTTTDALAAKNRFATESARWSGISTANQLAWKAWAATHPINDALGQSQILQANAAFVGINSRLAQASATLIDTPPVERDPDGLLTLTQTCDIGTGTFDLAFTGTPLAADDILWIRAAVVNHGGINYVTNLLRVIGFSAAAQASPFDHQTQVEAKFGTLSVGQFVHVWIHVFDTTSGLLSAPFHVKTAVIDTP